MTKQQHEGRKEHNGKLPHHKRVTRRTHARRNEEWNSANELDAASSFHFFTARSATYSFSMRITCRQATRSEVEVEPRFLYDKMKPLDADIHVASESIIQLQHAAFGNHLNQQYLVSKPARYQTAQSCLPLYGTVGSVLAYVHVL